MKSVRGFIEIETHTWSKGKKTAYVCYPGMCGSMMSTIKWAHQYAKSDTDFALQVLDLAIKEQDKVRNVIKRFNRRFG
jgi:hypothetical protein|tara:strand:+ start:399 stop:632 length:234 start_codon:yes stop_codon:yes gene_type:complete